MSITYPIVTNVVLMDITRDPAFDPSICSNCGGMIGCEFCPRHDWIMEHTNLRNSAGKIIGTGTRMLPPIIDADPGDETTHEVEPDGPGVLQLNANIYSSIPAEYRGSG